MYSLLDQHFTTPSKEKKRMSSYLTERQRKDLHEAIYDYLLTDGLGLSKAAEVFKQEALGGVSALTSSSGNCLLEKKWTSVVRLVDVYCFSSSFTCS